jgi:hypothetical protein
MSSASDIFCANFDISTCSVLERNLVKRLNDVVFNDSPSTDTPMVLASPTVFAEEFQSCWLFSESILTRAIEGHPFLPRFFAFFRDRCGFNFFNVETVEDCILELARRFYSNAGISEWSEYSQDNVNLIFTKLRCEIGPSVLAAKLRKPLAAAASFDVVFEKEHFCAEQVAEVVAIEDGVRALAPADDIEAAEIEALAHSVQPDIAARIGTEPIPETMVILGDNVLPSTIKNPAHMSPPRYFPPSSRVLEPDKLTNCDKSGPCLVFLEACHLDILASKKTKKQSECGISCYHGIVF